MRAVNSAAHFDLIAHHTIVPAHREAPESGQQIRASQ
jgi:hypothetical protein